LQQCGIKPGPPSSFFGVDRQKETWRQRATELTFEGRAASLALEDTQAPHLLGPTNSTAAAGKTNGPPLRLDVPAGMHANVKAEAMKSAIRSWEFYGRDYVTFARGTGVVFVESS